MSETTTTKPALLPKPRTNVEYLTTFGYCPVCDSPEVEGESFDTEDGRHVIQDVSCLLCMAGWTDVYRLQGYRSLEDAVGKAIPHDESFPAPFSLTERELAHVLAALRYVQRLDAHPRPISQPVWSWAMQPEWEIFEDNPLDAAEIDALCERINGETPGADAKLVGITEFCALGLGSNDPAHWQAALNDIQGILDGEAAPEPAQAPMPHKDPDQACPHCRVLNYKGAQTTCCTCSKEGCTSCTEEREGCDYHKDCDGWADPLMIQEESEAGACINCHRPLVMGDEYHPSGTGKVCTNCQGQ